MEGRWRAGRIFWLSQLHLIPPVSAARNSWPPLPDNSVCCTPGDWPYHPDDYLLIEIRRALKSAKLRLFEEEDDCRVPHQAVRLSAWGEMLRVVILGNCFGHWLARSMWQNMKPLPTHQTYRQEGREVTRHSVVVESCSPSHSLKSSLRVKEIILNITLFSQNAYFYFLSLTPTNAQTQPNAAERRYL